MKKIIPLLAVLMVLGVNAANAEDVNAKLQQLQQALALKPDDAKLLNDMGLALYEVGKYDEAEPLYLKSLSIWKKSSGENPNFAESLNNLALLYAIQGKYAQAEPLYQQSLAIRKKVLGKNHIDVAESLHNLAAFYQAEGKYTEAIPLYLESHSIWEKALGKNDSRVAISLNALATLYFTQKKYTEAEPLFRRSLEIQKKVLGENHPDIAISLGNLGIFYLTQGKYIEAESLFQKSLAIQEKVLGKNHPNLAISLSNLAELYRTQRKYTEAESLLKRSLAIRENTLVKDHPDIATNLNNLAALYDTEGNYTQAESLYKRSLEIRETALGKYHSDVAESLNNLAAIYQVQGNYSQAESLFLRSLVIYEKNYGKVHPRVAESLNYLALLYQAQGNNDQAEPLFLRSLAIREQADKNSSNVANSLDNLASLYHAQGKYAEAESLHLRSLKIYDKVQNKNTADIIIKNLKSLSNLANLYQTQGKYAQAEYMFQRCSELLERVLGKNHPDVAISLSNLAAIYQVQGKYEQAELLYQRSLQILEKVLGKFHPDVASNLNNLATLYNAQGKYTQGEPLLQRSLEIREKKLAKDHPDIAHSLENLVALYNKQGNYAKAEPLLQRSLRVMNQSLEHWLWGASEKTRQFYMQQEQDMRNVYLSFYSLRNTAKEAFYFSLSRKGLLLKIASEIGVVTKSSPELKSLRTQISNLAYSNQLNKISEIKALEEKSNNLELQLLKTNSNFKRNKREVTPEQVLEKLNSGQLVIDFLVYTDIDLKNIKPKTDQIIALVADKQKGIKLIKLGEFSPIADAIKTYLNYIQPPTANDIQEKKMSEADVKKFLDEREEILPQTAKQLYSFLWQPLIPYLQNKKTVYLIPDGDLHLLPFKALQDPDGKYLAEKWQLITLSSARDIVLPPLEGKANQAAIFAAPDYGDDTAIIKAGNTAGATEFKQIHFKPLASAFNEGQRLNLLFQNNKQPAQLLTENKATESAVNAVKSPKILHLATHGYFLPDVKPPQIPNNVLLQSLTNEPLVVGKIENPLTRSFLAFANANLGVKGEKQADNTDGILTALEVLNLNLVGTDLVTLSACDTGKGDVKIGEGVYSLNRAFQEAGAKAVLSTLWQVDDKATSEFMQKFYTRFLNGEPAQQAIQATQNEFMQHEKYRNPFYWAGFVMTGKE